MVPTRETKKNTFMNNVLVIVVSQLLVKILGLVYRLVITNIPGFGDAGNGFYSAGYQIYTLLLALSSVGIPNAIAKLVSERLALGDPRGAHRIFKVALGLFSGVGIACSLFLYFGADFLAGTVIRLPGTKYTLMALAPAIFFVCASSVIRGYFQGLQDMKATGSTQVLEQFFKSTLTVLIVLLMSSMSAELMAAGANSATSIACVLSFIYLLIYYKRKEKEIKKEMIAAPEGEKVSIGETIKSILMMSIPISLSSIILSVNRIIDTATITRGIEVAFKNGIPGVSGIPTLEMLTAEAGRLAGMLSKSDTLINLPLALNVGFATALVPAVSALLARGNKKEASEKVSFSLLVSILIILPCSVGMIVLAQPIYLFLYPGAPDGWWLLQLSSIALLFTAMNQTVYGSLQGMGKIFVPATGLLVGGIAKFILNVLLIRIPEINISGAAISSIACQLISFLICMTALSKTLPLSFTFGKYFGKPFLACLLMGVGALGSYDGLSLLGLPNTVSTLASILVAVVIYFGILFLLRTLSKEEVLELPMGARFIKLFGGKKHGN